MANILWVEDESKRISGLIRPLTKYGHNVKIAEDKKSAIGAACEELFDLIILDIIIPSGSNQQGAEINPYEGVNVLEDIKESKNANTPIVVLSVVNDSNILRKLERFGVKERLSKGALLPSELIKCVHKLLDIRDA